MATITFIRTISIWLLFLLRPLLFTGFSFLLISDQACLSNGDSPNPQVLPEKAFIQQNEARPPSPASLFFHFLQKRKYFSTKLEKEVFLLYKRRHFQPIWFFFLESDEDKNDSFSFIPHEEEYLQTALSVLFHAGDEGLNPTQYQEALDLYTLFAFPQQVLHTNLSLPSWQSVEFSLSLTFLKYIHHVKRGRVSPAQISSIFQLSPPPLNAVYVLEEVLKNASRGKPHLIDLALTNMEPQHRPYQELKELLFELKQEKKRQKYTSVKLSQKLKRGDTGKEVKKLMQILILRGDLNRSAQKLKGVFTIKFDGAVEKALKAFQLRHSLEPDGIVGRETMKRLNQSLTDRINTVIANMERWRWYPDSLQNRPSQQAQKKIIVNIAGYELKAFQGNKLSLSCKAIVGTSARPTPIFKSEIVNLILNPAWHVPPTLFKDKISVLAQDPGYAERYGFTIFDKQGAVIDPYMVDWQKDGLLYKMKQKPGKFNALGTIRFTLDNVNNRGENSNTDVIYMHDTSRPQLFQKASRSLSSGCIRLEKPLQIAEWIFSSPEIFAEDPLPQRSPAQDLINVNLQSVSLVPSPPSPPQSVGLKKPLLLNAKILHEKIRAEKTVVIPTKNIPVYFTYETLWINDDGSISCSDDPYGLDKSTLEALERFSKRG